MAGTMIQRPNNGMLYLVGNPTSIGANILLAALAANVKIRVHQVSINGVGANTIVFKSGTTEISPLYSLSDTGGLTLPYSPDGWFETAANAALNCSLTAATPVAILIGYKHTT